MKRDNAYLIGNKHAKDKGANATSFKKGFIPWNKGKKNSQKAWNKGKKLSEKHIESLIISHKGQKSWNRGKKFSETAKQNMSNSHLGQKAWNKGIKCPQISGENHYNWKGGAKTEIIKIRSSAEYKVWRLSVYERDWFTCQMPVCGYKGRDIECHHIRKVKEYPDLILEKSNGITLCKSCHKKIRNKEKQFVGLFEQILAIRLT